MRVILPLAFGALLSISSLAQSGHAHGPLVNLTSIQPSINESSLQQASRWFSGSFQSGLNQNDANINLNIKPIWSQRTDGPWFVMEQTGPESKEIERFLRMFMQDGMVTLRFYYLPKVYDYQGDHTSANDINSVSFEHLIARTGCDIVLWQQNSMSFEGDNLGGNCHLPYDPSMRSNIEMMLSPGVLSLKVVGFQDGEAITGNSLPTLFMRQQTTEELLVRAKD